MLFRHLIALVRARARRRRRRETRRLEAVNVSDPRQGQDGSISTVNVVQ